jgi:hypothetical protein
MDKEGAIGCWAYQTKKEEEEQINIVVNEKLMSLKDYKVYRMCANT